MNTALIILLSIALLGAAFFTRPTEQGFRDHVKAHLPPDSRAWPERMLKPQQSAEQFLREAQFKDRYLWVQVEKDGRVVYTGAFDHWFEHGTRQLPMRQ